MSARALFHAAALELGYELKMRRPGHPDSGYLDPATDKAWALWRRSPGAARWISVEERPPEEGSMIALIVPGWGTTAPITGYLSEEGFRDYDGDLIPLPVTRWLDLPIFIPDEGDAAVSD